MKVRNEAARSLKTNTSPNGQASPEPLTTQPTVPHKRLPRIARITRTTHSGPKDRDNNGIGTTMALTLRTVEYFYSRIENDPGMAYQILAALAAREISLLAFSAVPYPSGHMELTLFPDDSPKLVETAQKQGWSLIGPQHAILIQGDDHLGALADIHKCLNEARVSIYASTGITDGAGHYGYIIYVREDDHLVATRALEKVSSTLVAG